MRNFKDLRKCRAFLQPLAVAGIAVSIPLASAIAADWSQAVVIRVLATENVFTPSTFVFRKGVAYRLHIENNGKELTNSPRPSSSAR